jgi:purine-binding chemotaxis protein CheW
MADATVAQSGGATTADLAGKYLTFKLADEEYGLEILKVREIIGLLPITSLPRTPDFVRGVINLRGKVIPVIDLRRKFELDATADTDQTCIIVVDVAGNFGSVQIGILVDSVSEVLDIRGEEIEDPPTFGSSVDTAFILGMAKAKGTVKILLNIEKVLSQAELEHVASVG